MPTNYFKERNRVTAELIWHYLLQRIYPGPIGFKIYFRNKNQFKLLVVHKFKTDYFKDVQLRREVQSKTQQNTDTQQNAQSDLEPLMPYNSHSKLPFKKKSFFLLISISYRYYIKE